MDNAIQQFNFEGKYQIRVVERDGEPWFVAVDVCGVLGILNSSDAIKRLDDDERDDLDLIDPIGRKQRVNVINEPGLYSFILRSDKPEAKAFKRWITHDVIPSIRKTGAYSLGTMSPERALLAAVQQMVEHSERLAEHDQRLSDIEIRQTAIERGAEYFTVIAYASRKGRHIDENKAREIGKHAARYSRKNGYLMGEAPHPYHGKVNTYHIAVLEAVYP